MTKARFTKGDWYWDHNNESACTISVVNSNGVEICSLKSEDDAHLIAAAPEMYEYLSHMVDHDMINDHTVEREVKSLLAKARGEQL